MQQLFSLFFLVFALCFHVPQATADLIGADNRLAVPATQNPYPFVGKLLTSAASCTATLVGESTIVTNAHCVISKGSDSRTFRFVVYTPAASYDSVLASNARVLKIGTMFPAMSPEKDWAILQLDLPLGAQVGFARVRDDRSVGPVALVSFASDFQFGLNPGFESCTLVTPKQFDFFGAHNCDTFQGASGAPLMRREGTTVYLVGMNAAGVTHAKNDVFNISVPTFQFLSELNQIF